MAFSMDNSTLGFGEAVSQPFCATCEKYFGNRSIYDAHLAGTTHRAQLQKMGVSRLGGCEPHFQHIGSLLSGILPPPESKS